MIIRTVNVIIFTKC